MARASGDVWAAASALSFSGSVALTLGDPGRARPLLEESTRLSVESGDREVFVHATAMLAEAMTALGAMDEARAQLVTGRDAALETTNPLGVVLLLDAAAGWLAAASAVPAAVEAWAATERFRIDHHWPEPSEEEEARRAAWAAAREAIGTVRFEMLWADGGVARPRRFVRPRDGGGRGRRSVAGDDRAAGERAAWTLRPHAARAGGVGDGRRGPVRRRDRGAAGDQQEDGVGARRQHQVEARRVLPRRGGDDRGARVASVRARGRRA